MSELESFRGHEFRGVEELAATASKLVEQYTNEPARGHRLGITTRIVRHYLSEGLLGAPTGHAGPVILFNYGNLLRLLAVKKLLADHWSLVKVRELISSLDLTALEQLVANALASSVHTPQRRMEAQNDSARGLKMTQRLPANSVAPQVPPPMALAAAPPLASFTAETAKRAERAAAEWIEIATGLEIKIRRSFRPPRNEQERARLAARFWSVVNGNGGEK
jgi:DNA-binding transcriptional MerR regulator